MVAACAVEAEGALIPAVAQGGGDGVFPGAEQAGQVEGLVLLPEIVGVEAGEEVLVSGLPAVDGKLINPQAAGVGPGGDHVLGEGETLLEDGVGLFIEAGGDPPGGPAVLSQGRLEPGGVAHSGIAGICGGGDPPEVPGPGGGVEVRLEAGAGDVLPAAAVVEDLRKGFIGGDLDPGPGLGPAVAFRQPGEYRT